MLPIPEHQQIQKSKKPDTIFQKQTNPTKQIPLSNPMAIIQRAKINPKSLTHADVMQLQRTIGNRAVGKLLSEIGIISSTAKPVQRQENSEDEETCPSFVQRQEIPEEEELLKGKMIETIQRQEIPEEEEPLQEVTCPSCSAAPVQREENRTGMPDNLKAGLEQLSGTDLSDVRVHRNSSKPEKFGALAYTQGKDIHVAPGQEKHLPHEGWHAVQQMQGRVKPSGEVGGLPLNDNRTLESEADAMGRKALQQYAQVEKPKENKSQSVAKDVFQKQSGGESTFQFVDNRSEAVVKRKLQEMANNSQHALQLKAFQEKANNSPQAKQAAQLQAMATNSIQRMKAYDGREPATDPRHFSTSDIKAAIDACVIGREAIPYWLKEQVLNYLRDELSERYKDMGRHGGGDMGHQHYFMLVQQYVNQVESLPEDEGAAVPTLGPALQLRAKRQGLN